MNPVHAHQASLVWVGGKLVLSLVVVVALFMGAVWLLRFLQKRVGPAKGGPGPSIEIRTTCALAPKTTLSIVAVGEESFLIGVTPQGISLLTRLGDGAPAASPETKPAIEERDPVRSAAPAPRTPYVQPAPQVTVAPPEVRSPEESFENQVLEALNKIKEGRTNRESAGGVRRWSV